MEKKISFEAFKEAFLECTDEEQIDMYETFSLLKDREKYPWYHLFNEDFFDRYMPDPMNAARAVYFGDIKSWKEPYIIINGQGNLETRTTAEYAEAARKFIREIYEDDSWGEYIQFEE
jgi:hypothetical protein